MDAFAVLVVKIILSQSPIEMKGDVTNRNVVALPQVTFMSLL